MKGLAMEITQRKLVLSAVIVAVVVSTIVLITRSERQRDLVLKIEPVDASDDVTVYVGGAVQDPGLYSLPRGSRIADALDLAGRSDETDVHALDLASTLRDEQTIMVPKIASSATTEGPPDAPEGGAMININTASQEQLELLPGIGPVYASRIIDRRTNVGPFTSLDELTEISGISDGTVEDLRELAVVDS